LEQAVNNSAQLDLLSNAVAAIALGDALFGLGRIDEADGAYRRALALGQETSRCFMGLGKVARARGDHEGALFQFRRADPSETASLEVATSLGYCRRIDEAMELLCGLLASRPSFLEAARLLARLLRQKTSPPPGLNGFLDQPFDDMNSFWSRHEVALALLDIGCLNEAEAIFNKSGIQFPHSTAPFIGRSTIARKRADPEQALIWLQRAEVLDPDNSYVKLEIANNLRGLERYDEARDAYRALLTHPTHRRSALIGLYYCLSWSGDHVAAGALFDDVYACV
jgi:tetratricopeptide (TPR) repeat protein